MAGSLSSEIEAKLLVPREADLRALAHLDRLGSYTVRERDAVRLYSVYVDTTNLTLARDGIALRLRRQARQWELTAKWAGHTDGDIHDRPELTLRVPAAPRFPYTLPTGPLRRLLGAYVAGRPLEPVLVTTVHRRRFDVLRARADANGQPVAELALDRVHLHAPGHRQAAMTYFELEVELLQGERRDITSIARLLREQFDLAPSSDSKFARGLMLLYGQDFLATASAPVRADDTLEVAARKVFDLHLRRLRQHDPATRLGEDPEALHDMRVACRRLRAAVRAFEAGIPAPLKKYLEHELKWLGELLGSVRDWDVQLDLLDRYRAAVADQEKALLPFREYLQAERTRQRAPMLSGLDSKRYYRLLVRLESFATGRTRHRARAGAFSAPVAAVGSEEIKKAFRRVLKRGRKIREAPTDQDLHTLRIRAKRLRYLLEFLREITGKPGRRLVKQMIGLQDLLGGHHDAVVAAAVIRRYVEGPGLQATPDAFLALGAFIGEQRRLAENARSDFKKAWRHFSRQRTVQDVDAVVRQLQLQRREPDVPANDSAVHRDNGGT